MEELLRHVVNASVLTFAITSMLSVGLGHTLREIIEPLHNLDAVVRALLANFIVVPLLAFVVAQLLSLQQPLAIGLLLIGMAAGAPFLIKLTETANHDVGAAAALLVLLLPVTVLYLPLVLPLVAPGVVVSGLAIAQMLGVTMLLPLLGGLAVRAIAPRLALRLRPAVSFFASIALIVVFLSTLILHYRAISELFGSGAILAAALVIIGAFAIGFLLGPPRPSYKEVLGLGTAQRNIAAATVVAAQSIGNSETLIMVVISSVVGLVILFPIAWSLNRRTGGRVRDVVDVHMTGRG